MSNAPQPVTIPDNRTPLLDSNGLLSRPWMYALQNIVSFIVGFLPRFLSNTHAKRLAISAANYPDGTVFYESDRTVYYVARGKVWVYFAGEMSTEQNALPADLTANDAGFLAYVNDYAHLLQWTGTAWTWAPGESGSDYSVPFVTGPDVATGWHVCDGSAVLRLVSDGTLANATTPNTAGSWYRQ